MLGSGMWGTLMLKRKVQLCICLPVEFGGVFPLCDQVEK